MSSILSPKRGCLTPREKAKDKGYWSISSLNLPANGKIQLVSVDFNTAHSVYVKPFLGNKLGVASAGRLGGSCTLNFMVHVTGDNNVASPGISLLRNWFNAYVASGKNNITPVIVTSLDGNYIPIYLASFFSGANDPMQNTATCAITGVTADKRNF